MRALAHLRAASLLCAALPLHAVPGFCAGQGQAESSIALHRQEIRNNWRFRQADTQDWREAQVPGNVHADLIASGKIPDPYYRTNENQVQWVSTKDWEYATTFTVTKGLLQRKNLVLEFNGLDTYAEVFLNGERVLSADNMFVRWTVPCKDKLVAGENHLLLRFLSPLKVNLPKWQNAPYRLQAWPNNDQADVQLSLYSRKAGFHYGWDWGPRLVTSGIWRKIYLTAWNDARIDDMQIFQRDVKSSAAQISAQLDITADTALKARVELVAKEDPAVKLVRDVALTAGTNRVNLDFTVHNPRLWWTNGLGGQPLYTFTATLGTGRTRTLDRRSVRTGLRSLRIVREADTFGKSMYVELNGIPVFMKGANYIPMDNLQNRVTPERYEQMIRAARDANMNMLRVWAGGIYEEDTFYDLADAYGILVWQDLMFACGMFPTDEAFLQSVRLEITQNVKRLRNHPSIALWCGNNENEISWYGWGWKDLYTSETQRTYEKDLHKLFYEVVPQAIAAVDPGVYYHPSSPITGFDGRPDGEGDIHYWSVWHGKAPFESFNTNIARFMSEYGFQSYPQMSTIEKFTLPEDRNIESDVMLSHQRCMADNRKDKRYGNRLIEEYMRPWYRAPKDFAAYLYLTQVLQAEGVKVALEAHRRNRPQCMGTLFWQIDDCWPVASWSSIDYYGNWKALHYFARNAYQNLLISVLEDQDTLEVYAVSDLLDDTPATLQLTLMDFDGLALASRQEAIAVTAASSAVYFSTATADLLAGHDKNRVFLDVRLVRENKVLAEQVHFFGPSKDLDLLDPGIQRKVLVKERRATITLQATHFAKNVYLNAPHHQGFFSDNYFHLIPGRPVTVFFDGEGEPRDLGGDLQVISLYDSYTH